MKSNFLKMNGLTVYALILCSIIACGKKVFKPVASSAATLTVASQTLQDREGGSLLWNMVLDQPLDKPAQIKVNTNTANYKTNYANPEDFTAAEYSYDNGATWNPSKNNVIEIPAQKTSVRVRIPLVRDGAPEILEEKLQVSFTHANPNEVDLKGYTPTSFEAAITDTDVAQDVRSEINGSNDETILVFEKDASGAFKLLGVSTAVRAKKGPFALKQKQLIDGGYREVIDFISALLIKPVDVAGQIHISLDPDFPLTGAVGTIRNNTNFNSPWDLYFNIVTAFYSNNSPDRLPLLDKLNTNSWFGTTVLHEIGHLYTIYNNNHEMPNADSPVGCSGTFLRYSSNATFGRCFKDTSYAHHFISGFYDLNPDNTLKGAKDKSNFVTQYASTLYTEDMADCFQYYIRMAGTPIKDNNNPLSAQNKVALFEEFPQAKELKRHFKKVYTNMQPVSDVMAPYTPLPQSSAYQPNIFAYESTLHKGCVRTEHMSPFPKH